MMRRKFHYNWAFRKNTLSKETKKQQLKQRENFWITKLENPLQNATVEKLNE